MIHMRTIPIESVIYTVYIVPFFAYVYTLLLPHFTYLHILQNAVVTTALQPTRNHLSHSPLTIVCIPMALEKCGREPSQFRALHEPRITELCEESLKNILPGSASIRKANLCPLTPLSQSFIIKLSEVFRDDKRGVDFGNVIERF